MRAAVFPVFAFVGLVVGVFVGVQITHPVTQALASMSVTAALCTVGAWLHNVLERRRRPPT